jgi:hypothetical protein
MVDVPDWLWQGMTIWAAGKSIEWAWKHRRTIAEQLRKTPEDIVIQLQPLSVGVEAQPAIVTAEANLYATGNLDATGKVQAHKPSLARRLEELAAWYLHVS